MRSPSNTARAGDMSDNDTVSTLSLPLAAYWLAQGLALVEISAVEDPRNCRMTFHDPEHRERALTAAFHRNVDLRQFVAARGRIGLGLTLAKEADDRRCNRARLDAELAKRSRRRGQR